jgi:hypothetical protein
MKANPATSTNEATRTVLMVDGHGRIRTIHRFHQKLRIGIALAVCALLVAAGAGWLYAVGLQTQRELQQQIDALQARVAAAEHQKELLLARAVKAEARGTPPAPARTPTVKPKAAPLVAPTEEIKPPPAPAAKPDPVAPDSKNAAVPSAPPATAVKPEPVVSVTVEKLEVAYQVSQKALATEFIIRNTGSARAEGRAVVVLSTAEGANTPRLSLPLVPLQNDRPLGRRGQRFSITHFMRVKIQRKVAEPGLKFDTADVFVFDMQGKLLQEKTFAVALVIPDAKPPEPAAAVSPAEPAVPEPIASPASNSILAIPSNSRQESQGGQED